MASRTQATIHFDALSIEGAILPPEWLGRVAALDAPAQSPADYGVRKGLQLRDEITRFWRIGEAIWSEFDEKRGRGNTSLNASTTFATQLLKEVFEFDDLTSGGERTINGRKFTISLEARGGKVPIVLGAPGERLDESLPRHGDSLRRRSAWGALQEYLNAADETLWGIATNGLRLRIGRDNGSLTRPAWIEADLERIFTEERFADFSVLWLVLHASRFGPADGLPSDCPLEQWRAAAAEAGSRARETLRTGVEAALLALGKGFLTHPANVALRERLSEGSLSAPKYFNELLRLVYRMIFLLTIEEREIIHAPINADATDEEKRRHEAAKRLYADGYGLRRLRERALRRGQYDRNADLWASLQPVFRALGGAHGEPLLGLPGLGGLFSPEQCPDLDGASLENRALLDAVFRLAWLRDGGSGPLTRVNWKDMGPEEFGSVYESLLELVPVVTPGDWKFAFAGADESAGNLRKLTGSYYTPDSLVQQLLDTTLEPVIADRLDGAEDPQAALLSITVIDPACGSGHFLLAAARRLAGHLARLRAGGTPGADEYRHALRDVVTHNIHGVDRNPMALELARMALWLEAYTPDRALGFLDHHLVCGDSLLGLLDISMLAGGIPDEAFKALSGDDKDVARLLARANRDARRSLERRRKEVNYSLELGVSLEEEFAALEAIDDGAVEGVKAKRARYEELRAKATGSGVALAADLYVGAFLVPKRFGEGERALSERQAAERFPATGTLMMALDGTLNESHSVAVAARAACREARVLHWKLAFPAVFARAGFDAVLGNPPWERIKLQEQEFFATRAPEIATARNAAERQRLIRDLENTPPGSPERGLFEEFNAAKRDAEAASVFCHGEARYPLTGVGDVNTYALFAETAYRMITPDGRAGLVLPTGIATDDSTKKFFGEVTQTGRLVSLYDFENREGLFPAVDSRMKFCLFTVGRAEEAEFSFFATQVEQIRDSRRRFRLSAEDFRLINPNTRTCPVFRSEYDAELTKKIYRNVPVLIDESRPGEEGNPWGLTFMAMFHMSNDSGMFLDSPEEGALPLYEAKMIHQFDHRWATYEPARDGSEAPESRIVTAEEKADSEFSVRPRYWVPGAAVRIKTNRVPPGLVEMFELGDERGALSLLTQWIAGYYLNRGDEEKGNRFLSHLDSVGDTYVDGMTRWHNAQSVEDIFPLSEAEIRRMLLQDNALDTVAQLIESRQPKWLMGWRDIARATDERTTIVSVLPRSGVGNNLPIMLPSAKVTAEASALLLANLNALVLDFAARFKVGGTHLNFFVYRQLPMLPPTGYTTEDAGFIVPRVLELTYTAEDLSDWAADLGYFGAPFGWDPERRAVLRAELDAYYAKLYGLTHDELRYVLDPEDVKGARYPSETFRVLKSNEVRQFGEYRTRRMVLEAWDRLFGTASRLRSEPVPERPVRAI